MNRVASPGRVARRRRARRGRHHRHSGVVLIWFALLLVVLFGMLGLVVDGGLLMAGHRQAQNAADAAALAAAMDKMHGRTNAQATATATEFVQDHNGLVAAPAPVVNIPPVHGPYAGMPDYVEVIVTSPSRTFFVHILPGVAPDQQVRARAVAGFEAVSAGEGVAVLDPHARPGLAVTGGGILKVLGQVIVNSEGGGEDQFGVKLDAQQTAATASNNSTFLATRVHVVGGVNDRTNFYDYHNPTNPEGYKDVLYCRQSPIPDPLMSLPTPTTGNGVLDVNRDSVSVLNNNVHLPDEPESDHLGRQNEQIGDTVYIYPGIYRSIQINSGKVVFAPGIYVLSPKSQTSTALSITGGDVIAEGIMFYNTGNSYSAASGSPDINDEEKPPPGNISDLDDGTAFFGGFTINAGMQFSPIDTVNFPVAGLEEDVDISVFNGMLFYQRRRNARTLSIAGNAADGQLKGTLYAKWARVDITGQGTYSAQFVVGRMSVSGSGNVTLQYAGENLGRAPRVFLVE